MSKAKSYLHSFSEKTYESRNVRNPQYDYESILFETHYKQASHHSCETKLITTSQYNMKPRISIRAHEKFETHVGDASQEFVETQVMVTSQQTHEIQRTDTSQ
ncbi:MAG: hypothetical protein KAR20_06765 [Candidatus Heimdallarchaeota archaeon]|nr:hypothetical protein [Candidatus Heimdallarchaeota archaeon]